MGRKNIGLIIDVLNHNKTDPNLRNVSQKLTIPEHLQADWDRMAGKTPKAASKTATAKTSTAKKTASKTTAPKSAATKKASTKAASKTATPKKAAAKKPRTRQAQLMALALAYAKAEAGNLFNNNDGAEDVAADEVIDHILATKGKPGEDEDSFDRDAIEACLNAAFEEFDNILERSFEEDE